MFSGPRRDDVGGRAFGTGGTYESCDGREESRDCLEREGALLGTASLSRLRLVLVPVPLRDGAKLTPNGVRAAGAALALATTHLVVCGWSAQRAPHRSQMEIVSPAAPYLLTPDSCRHVSGDSGYAASSFVAAA